MHSITKNKLKEFSSLKHSKIRDERGLFLVEGVKMVKEAINSRYEVLAVCGLETFWKDYSDDTNYRGIDFYVVSDKELRSLSHMTTPNQVVAVLKQHRWSLPSLSSETELVLALESVRNPGNLGTILRIADWFGIHNVFCSLDTVEVYNPKTIQATMGSFFRVNTFYVDLLQEIDILKHHHRMMVFGLALQGESIYSASLPSRGVILVGNESKGLSSEILKKVDNPLLIPAYTGNHAESLNAAVATAIACSEFRRGLIVSSR